MAYINLPPALQQLFQKIEDRLTRLELAVRFTAPNVTSDPTNPRNGDLFVNTTTTVLKIIIAGLTRTIAFLETAQTWALMQTFSSGITITTGGATVTAGGVTVTAGGVTVNGGTTAVGVFDFATTATGTTVGAAGGATALPATPLGYVTVKIAGVDRKIPYYNV